jgi:hypothetical protein
VTGDGGGDLGVGEGDDVALAHVERLGNGVVDLQFEAAAGNVVVYL